MPKNVMGIGIVYDASELADVLGVAESTIIRYWKSGRLPGQKVGAFTYFTADALKNFLEGTNQNKKHIQHKGKPDPKESPKDVPREKSQERLALEAEQVEQMIDALKKTGNKKSDAAKLLGWADRTFRERFNRFGLGPKVKVTEDPKNKSIIFG